MLANSVSPPASGVSLAKSIVAFAGFGLNIWSVCQTSPNALVSPFSLMRVIVDFAETLSKGDLLLGREGLVAEKDHKMLEPGGLYFPERFIIQGTQVDVGDFSAERSCDRLDFDLPIGCHGLRLS